MNVFIDTNIYLTFYHLTKDDLEELRKIVALHQENEVQVWLPDQVADEFKRNREVKIADALKRFREDKMNKQIPQMVKEYSEYDELVKAMRSYESAKSSVLNKIMIETANKALKADEVVKEMFQASSRINVTAEILDRARVRYDKGNPPGKNGSYGDSINWESLLFAVPNKEDLHIISEDGDYECPLNDGEIRNFLNVEWRYVKSSELYLYKSLSTFLSKHFPKVKLAAEVKKELLIRGLVESGSFTTTHSTIAGLSKYAEFSKAQISEIANACLTNSQVYYIIGDEDVLAFYKDFITKYQQQLETSAFTKIQELIANSAG